MAISIEVGRRFRGTQPMGEMCTLEGGRASLGGEKFKTTYHAISHPDSSKREVIVTTTYLERASGRQFDQDPVVSKTLILPEKDRTSVKLPGAGTIFLRSVSAK